MADFSDLSKCRFREKEAFEYFNTIVAEVATTGYCGGDSGHGGRTYLRLTDADSTDMDVRTSEDKYGCRTVEIMLGGDSELETFIDALRWAADTLEKMSEEKN